MKFSIVTTSYNFGNYIGEAIESAWDQREDVEAFEHIIADGASTDCTSDVLAQFAHLDVVSEKDGGIYDGMNKAIARATGDVIVILNADDILPPGALAAARQAFAKTDADIISGGFQLITGQKSKIKVAKFPTRRPTYEGLLFGISAINARFIRRTVFERVGPFDQTLKLAADRAWLINSVKQGIVTQPISAPLYIYRSHEQSATLSHSYDSSIRIYREHAAMCQMMMAEADPDLRRALGSLAAVERLKIAVHTDIKKTRANSAAAKTLCLARQFIRAAVEAPLDLVRGLRLWWRYRSCHADT